jgi:hypothetical protein
MRRALFAVLAALPALAYGQSVVVKTNSNSNLLVVNRAQCAGSSSNSDVGITDDVTASLTWTIQPAPDTSYQSTGNYKVWVTQAKPAAGQTKAGATKVETSCTTNLNGDGITVQQLGNDVANSGQTVTVESVSLQTLVQKAGISDCTTASDVTIYVCVQQVNGASELGWALATLQLDRTSLPAPTELGVTSGDSVLHVSCHSGSGDTSSSGTFKAKATPRTSGLAAKFSGENASCSDLKISGLKNGETYDVTAYRLDENHNPSDASSSVSGSPTLTNDFWDECKADGCPEKGGCSTGGLAAGLLGALSTLVVLRRRKS